MNGQSPSSGDTPSTRETVLGKHCPICTYWGDRIFRSHGYGIRECRSCCHRWAEIDGNEGHIDRIYDDSYFCGGGAGYPDYIDLGPLLRDHGRRYGRLLRSYVEPGSLLDVGAAAGFVLRGMVDQGWAGEGVEPNNTMAAFARDHLGVQVTAVAFEDFRAEKQFDVVSMIQVLPHFVDPKSALDHASRLTKPGGCLLIETWNCRSWTARLWGHYWHEYSPPSVLHWFSPATLRRIAKGFNFEEIACGRPIKKIAGAHLKSLIHFKTKPLLLRPLRAFLWLIPGGLKLPYPAEDLFWMLLRKRDRSLTKEAGPSGI